MEGAPGQQLSPAEEQEKWLHEAFKAVKQHAFYMKRALVRREPARSRLRLAAVTSALLGRGGRARPRGTVAVCVTMRARARRMRTTCAMR
jgi:hypothetical protein